MAIPGYRLFSKDHCVINNKKGGGVALYISNKLHSVELDNLNSKKCESVWSRVYVDSNKYIIVGVCYRRGGC